MAILVICQDSEKAPELRKSLAQQHSDYVETIKAFILASGPSTLGVDAMRNDDHDGSCYIYDTDDISIARKLFENDPYAKGGVFSQISFAKFNPSVGHWLSQ